MRSLLLVISLCGCTVLAGPVAAQTQPGEIAGHRIRVPGESVDGTTGKLSEVEAEMVARLPPQAQVERLLQYAISHHAGATDEIKARVAAWRGQIARTDALATLEEVPSTRSCDPLCTSPAMSWSAIRPWPRSRTSVRMRRFRISSRRFTTIRHVS